MTPDQIAAALQFRWEPPQSRYGTGERARIGRIGELAYWWAAERSRDDPDKNPCAASVLGYRSKSRFATPDEAKAWCERNARKLIAEALTDLLP